MKKIFLIHVMIALCAFLFSGCGEREKEIEKDITKQLDSIKSGNEDLRKFDIYSRINLQDTKLKLDDVDNSGINKIFGSMEWEIKDIQANNSTAMATLNITSKDVDKILSKDYIMTQLVLDYASYVRKSPNAERLDADSHIMDRITQIIQGEPEFTTTQVPVNVYLSSQTGKWSIAYDDDFIDALLGGMEEKYLIDIDDICEEATRNINIRYDYNKIMNLPDSNRTTRSSIKSPVLFNEEAYFDNSDYFFPKERYEIKIKLTEILRGSKAKEKVESVYSEGESTRILPVNQEYILFKIDAELVNNLTMENTVQLSAEDFSLLDSNGHFYNNCIIFGLDGFQPMKEGDKTSGWVCFTIDRGTTPYLLFKDYMDNTITFSN